MSVPPRRQPRWSRNREPGGANFPRLAGSPEVEEGSGEAGFEETGEPGLSFPPGPEAGSGPFGSAASAQVPPTGDASTSPPEPLPDELPRAFQLRRVYEAPAQQSNARSVLLMTLGGILLLSIGCGVGYRLAGSRAPVPATVGFSRMQPLDALSPELSPALQAQVDAAFDATKRHRFEEAQGDFAELYKAHPEWPSMAIEEARASLYARDPGASMRILSELKRNDSIPDTDFMMALVHLMRREFAIADEAFSHAVALDPARPDLYYFWGECLRSQGKPREAVEKFHSAMLRNQYETAESLYQLKLWLSEIQADEEDSAGTNAAIENALAIKPRPSYSALFASAARELKAGRIKEAADWIAKGQLEVEPVVFRVILQDPLFSQENWRPEIKNFYK